METFEFDKVSFKYPNADKLALDDITFKVFQSEFIVICGKSGCGKTTLLKHMKKNMIPYGKGEGAILYKGVDIETLDDRINAAAIGFVQQNPDNQIVTDKVWNELAFGLESLGCSNNVIKKRTAEMAEYFGISKWYMKNTHELSGGQKQLLNLASIMVMQPEVVVLDEPTAQLDPISAMRFINTLEKINKDLGTTIVISEHHLEDVFTIADRAIVMESGRIIADASPQEVCTYIKESDNEMKEALPAAFKISNSMTIKDSRNWLAQNVDKRNIKAHMCGKVNNEEQCRVQKSEKVQKQPQTDNQKNNIAIQVKNINFRYERNGQEILSDITFQLKKGKIMGLLGGNGAGKTTLLKIICNVIKPISGKVICSGKIIGLPQNPQAVFTEITIEEELAQALIPNRSLSDDEKLKRVKHMIEFMQLESYIGKNPYDLSGGEQQRLAIGKVLLLEPDILLLDEPTKGIDAFFKKTLGKIMKELVHKGMTILIVSHDIEFCAEYADECALLFNGNIVARELTRLFFGKNSFYTTSANKISRDYLENCVTSEQVLEALEEYR